MTKMKKPKRKKGLGTHIFISVGVLVLRLVGHWHFTIRAVVLTVVIGNTMVCYNHKLLDVSLVITRKEGSHVSHWTQTQVMHVNKLSAVTRMVASHCVTWGWGGGGYKQGERPSACNITICRTDRPETRSNQRNLRVTK